MKTKMKLLLGGVSAVCILAGVAVATPTVGAWYNVILSTGTVDRDIHAHAHAGCRAPKRDLARSSRQRGRQISLCRR